MTSGASGKFGAYGPQTEALEQDGQARHSDPTYVVLAAAPPAPTYDKELPFAEPAESATRVRGPSSAWITARF